MRSGEECIQWGTHPTRSLRPRTMRRALTVVLAGLLAGGPTARAQGDATIARVRGVAFDSLRGTPLAGAFVALRGSEWSGISDSLGHFAFDRVRPGTYQITVHHATLDTLGFSGLSTRVVIADAATELRVAVPSFTTLWRQACGESIPVPADSGFVYGTVRDALTNRPVPNARIGVTWYDSTRSIVTRRSDLAAKDMEAYSNARRKATPRKDVVEFSPVIAARVEPSRQPAPINIARWGLEARTDESGTYAVCGVPVKGLGIRISAATDSASSDSIDVVLDPRVRRNDLRVGPSASLGSVNRGTIVGQLSDAAGNPFAHARVFTADSREVRSDDSGRFTLREVPVGTRRVEIRYLGMRAARLAVDVVAGDTAMVTVALSRVPLLPGMRATATTISRVLAAEFDTRRRLGLGYVADSSAIWRHTSLLNVLRDVPSLTVVHRDASLAAFVPDGRGGTCVPTVWLDGVEAAYGNLFDLAPSEVVGLEVYTRPLTVPAVFVEKGGDRKCGAILVWTRYIFRNR